MALLEALLTEGEGTRARRIGGEDIHSFKTTQKAASRLTNTLLGLFAHGLNLICHCSVIHFREAKREERDRKK